MIRSETTPRHAAAPPAGEFGGVGEFEQMVETAAGSGSSPPPRLDGLLVCREVDIDFVDREHVVARSVTLDTATVRRGRVEFVVEASTFAGHTVTPEDGSGHEFDHGPVELRHAFALDTSHRPVAPSIRDRQLNGRDEPCHLATTDRFCIDLPLDRAYDFRDRFAQLR
ncbi:hypothetical protein JCM17092_07250 [Haloplanus litoreus]